MKINLTLMIVLLSLTGMAQNPKKIDTLNIKTSAQCDMCKEAIEYQMALEKGVKFYKLDVESQVLTVAYLTRKTDPETIRRRVSLTGYDADSLLADPEAYEALPDCCKKGFHKDESHTKEDPD
jgi:copper chaperone CopZ